MSQKKKTGGVSLFGSSAKLPAEDSSSSVESDSDAAPVAQRVQQARGRRGPGRGRASSDSFDSDSEREYYGDSGSDEARGGSGSDDDSDDDSLEELQKEMEEIPFEELRKMNQSAGSNLLRRKQEAAAAKKAAEAKAKGKEKSKASSKSSADGAAKPLSRRASKNAPIVVSAKAPLSHKPRKVVQVQKAQTRDPRFDSLSGNFQEERFRSSYGFINDIRQDELKQLKDAIKKERDHEAKQKLKEAAQIMENRIRADRDKAKQREIMQKHKKEEQEKVRQGKNPYFLKKNKIKEAQLEAKFDELKKKGGEAEVDRYMRHKRKRKAQKEIRFMPFKRRAVEGADGMPAHE